MNLINWTNPLINYKVDDYVEEKNLHFKLKGVSNISLIHKNNYSVSTVNIYTFMYKFRNIKKWQIVQSKNTDISLNYEGIISSKEKNNKGLIERLGNLKIKFNLNCFEYSGEGKINTFMIK